MTDILFMIQIKWNIYCSLVNVSTLLTAQVSVSVKTTESRKTKACNKADLVVQSLEGMEQARDGWRETRVTYAMDSGGEIWRCC